MQNRLSFVTPALLRKMLSLLVKISRDIWDIFQKSDVSYDMAGRRMKETQTNKIEMFSRGSFSAKAENSRYV